MMDNTKFMSKSAKMLGLIMLFFVIGINTNGQACTLDLDTNQTLCDGPVTITPTLGGATVCCEGITQIYAMGNVEPACLEGAGISGPGVYFQRDDSGPFTSWEAGDDLFLTVYDNGTATIIGSMTNGGQTAYIDVLATGGGDNSSWWQCTGLYNNVVQDTGYDWFEGTVTLEGVVYTVDDRSEAYDMGIGDFNEVAGTPYGLAAWAGGTWGEKSEIFGTLTPVECANYNTYEWSYNGGTLTTDEVITVENPGEYCLMVETCEGCAVMECLMLEPCDLGEYDLALIKEISDAQDQNQVLSEGDDVIFTITVCNQGEQGSGAYTVVDQLPIGMTYVSDDNGGSYDSASNTITWNLNGLASGACMSMDFTTNILTTPNKGYYRNFAEITSDSGDDEDSTPDSNTGSDNGEDITDPNDLFTNHNDSTQDTAADDEDDHDYEDIFVFGSAFFEGRVALQGATQNSPAYEMRASLTNDQMLPMTEPYDAMPAFQHVGGGGGETCDDALLQVIGPNQAVDWIFMELRDGNDPSVVVATCSVLVQADGDIMTPNGGDIISFDVPAGNYYVAVRHRNHLGVMTAEPVTFDGTALPMIDFTDPATPTWGTDAQKNVAGLMAMWAGNADSEGGVVFQGSGNDLNPIFFDVLTAPSNTGIQTNFIYQDYVDGDLDMNCKAVFQGGANDPNVIFFNILTHPGNSSSDLNFIITEQLPE